MEKRGRQLLNDPIRNRGTAFDEDVRDRLGLRGLLPPYVETLTQQVARVVEICAGKPSDFERYIFLMALQDSNETVFYRALIENLYDYLPIVYTPTVGEAAQQYAHIFRRPRGLYVSAHDRGRIADVIRNWPEEDVRVIVVTDGQRILGLGDLGANGMTIPIGKLALYTAAGGIPPQSTLPIMIDIGTDNAALRDDPLYLGLREPRLAGDDYLSLIDEFVAAVQTVLPRAMLQFEDFATDNAFALLNRYRDHVCTFNDDIQGTASVALAGILAGLRVTGGELSDHRLLFVGAGSANVGIGELVAQRLVLSGLTIDEARRHCWFVDSKGLVVAGRDRIRAHVASFAHPHGEATDLVEMIESLRPTFLVGATGASGVFPVPVLEAMARVNERPVIFALSNPTSRAECTAAEAYAATEGRAVFASGSPFAVVERDGRCYVTGQANNVYIFPGIGLAVMACSIRRLTDEMFLVAAQAVADVLPKERLETGAIYPELSMIREVSAAIAVAVSEVAFRSDLAGIERPSDLPSHIRAQQYWPDYG